MKNQKILAKPAGQSSGTYTALLTAKASVSSVRLNVPREYCPINQLLPPDSETTPEDRITQEFDTALEQFRQKCLFLYENVENIAQTCREASNAGDIERLRRAYEEHVKDRVVIFGIRPELNGSLRPT